MKRGGAVALLLFAGSGAMGGEIAQEQAFDLRLKEARHNLSTPEGARYEAAFSKEFRPQFEPRLAECLKRAPGEEAADFDLLIKVASDGRIEEALVRPESKLAACFRDETKLRRYPAPPSPGFWCLLGVHFALK
jgi:hypothetical protein